MPFMLKRKQFPISICYAMTINKSQGQTVKNVDIDGVIMDVGDIEYKHNNVKSLNLTLLDKSHTRFEISLWGTKATIFKIDFEHYRNKNVILVVTGLLVKKQKCPNIVLLVIDQTGLSEFSLKPTEIEQLTGYTKESLL
ncbi:hypothetical protein AgCh_008273 [Apium graveolens]